MLMVMIQTMEEGGSPDRARTEGLLLQVAAGDLQALAELYDCTRGAVYAMALSLLKHHHDAQDVTQDCFVRIWEKAGSYVAHGSPMAWILTIARNLALTRLRQGGRMADLDEREWAAIPADTPGLSPEDRQLLESALSVLSDRERQVVLLYAVSGLKHREIAGLLKAPLATVLSQYHRALKKLRAQLEGGEPT